jgi:hypothetical protein
MMENASRHPLPNLNTRGGARGRLVEEFDEGEEDENDEEEEKEEALFALTIGHLLKPSTHSSPKPDWTDLRWGWGYLQCYSAAGVTV